MICITFKDCVDIAQIITGIAAVFALIISIASLCRSNKISKGTFLLELSDKFRDDKRRNIHDKLQENKKIMDEEEVDLDDYLGLFEVCEIMMKHNSIEQNDFKKLYEYRLQNFLCNEEEVYKKLVQEWDKWDILYELLKRCFDKHKKDFDDLKNFAKELKDKDSGIGNEQFLNIMRKLKE